MTVPKGVCVRLGDRGELAACFNPETLCYEAVWNGGFVKFSATRHGFMDGLIMDGTPLAQTGRDQARSTVSSITDFIGTANGSLFAYRIGDVELLDAPWVEDGQFTRVVAPATSIRWPR